METFTTSIKRASSRSGEDRLDVQAMDASQDERPCELSHSAALLGQALTAAHSAPDIREDKVAAIKARIAAGTYEIDSMRLAEALVNENPGLFTSFN